MNKKLYTIIFLILFIIALGNPFHIAISGEKRQLALSSIVGFLKDPVSDNKIEEIITEFGVSFEVTSDSLVTLKSTGASDLIINAILSVTNTKTSFLYVSSEPAGAVLKIDGIDSGTTPGYIDDLSPGELNIWVGGLEEYNDSSEKTVEIRQGEFKTEHFLLDPKEEPTVSITFDTEPAGADLEIDGERFGKTPQRRVPLTEERHKVVIRLKGYETFNETIDIKRNGKDYYFYKLKIPVAFDTEPAGAHLKIGGDSFGKTPQRRVPLIEGEHEVIITLKGYVTINKTIEIKRGGKDKYSYKLESIPVPVPPKQRLRSEYAKVSIENMENIKHFEFIKKGFIIFVNTKNYYGYSKIKHVYEAKKPDEIDEVVIDNSTGLMWHPLGKEFDNWKKAEEWVNNLSYSGFGGWRLPTLEEAISLLEKKKNVVNDKYIHKYFNKNIYKMWTGDTIKNSKTRWFVQFKSWSNNGFVSYGKTGVSNSTTPYVIFPVRSMKR